MPYSNALNSYLRGLRKDDSPAKAPVGVIARLVVGRPGSELFDIFHPSNMKVGALPVPMVANLQPPAGTVACAFDLEQLQLTLPMMATMIGETMSAVTAGNTNAQNCLNYLSYRMLDKLKFSSVLILECGPHHECYELRGSPQEMRAFLEQLADDFGDEAVSASRLMKWIAEHPTGFGKGRWPSDAAAKPMRGLLARIVAGKTEMDRILIHDNPDLHEWRQHFEDLLEQKFKLSPQEENVSCRDLCRNSATVAWERIWITNITSALNVDGLLDEATLFSLHGSGLALFERLKFDNILMLQGDDTDEQVEILGHPLDAYHTASRLCADLRPGHGIAEVRAWIEANPDLFRRHLFIQDYRR